VCEMVTCANCGEEKPRKAKGLCFACYEYQRKHGSPRPADVVHGGNRRSDYVGDTCKNCGVDNVKAQGMCINCYNYARRHDGAMRPPLDIRYRKATQCINCGESLTKNKKRRGLCMKCASFLRIHGRMRTNADAKWKPDIICSNCRAAMADSKGLCKTCYNYQKRKGAPRAKKLYSRPERCKNCGYPTAPGVRNGQGRMAKGLCRPCYDYKNRHKKDRPAHMWGKGEHGWCDCGQPATRTIEIKITRNVDVLPVCESCYAEEMRQRRIYGDVTQRVGVNQQHSTR